MRGIVLAGGKGTRLLPATRVTNKHLIPILNKPMIEYPVETLLDFGCVDILIVTGGEHIGDIASYLGDGSNRKTRDGADVRFTYKVQSEAGGIAQALLLAEDFCRGEDMMVILGDNIFDNAQFQESHMQSYGSIYQDTAIIHTKSVDDPRRFGVVEFKEEGEGIRKIVEKPENPPSKFAVTGLYHYPSDVFDFIKKLKPSARGELEITDVNNWYADKGKLQMRVLGGFWSDAGTPESLWEVTNWVYNKK